MCFSNKVHELIHVLRNNDFSESMGVTAMKPLNTSEEQRTALFQRAQRFLKHAIEAREILLGRANPGRLNPQPLYTVVVLC